jgi:hypothetical protein
VLVEMVALVLFILGGRCRKTNMSISNARSPRLTVLYGSATGGTGVTNITISGINYAYTSFTSTGVLSVTLPGIFEILAFGGGGAGGVISVGATVYWCGGGGGGGIQQSIIYLDANQTITVGAGGNGLTSGIDPTSGTSSTVGTLLTAVGGGWGSFSSNGDRSIPSSGGCGGGASRYGTRTGGSGLQGFAGGTAPTDYPNGSGGGGGGAGAVGSNASGATGGAGGAGYDVSAFIGGSSLFKAGGGGGAGQSAGGAGGSSVGGAGATGSAVGTAAGANTAGGGGGAGDNGTAVRNGGNGGSGIVYVRWRV